MPGLSGTAATSAKPAGTPARVRRRRIRRIVPSPTRYPRPAISPWMRRYPQRGFSRASLFTSARTSPGDRRPSSGVRVRPLPRDQAAVPGQQGAMTGPAPPGPARDLYRRGVRCRARPVAGLPCPPRPSTRVGEQHQAVVLGEITEVRGVQRHQRHLVDDPVMCPDGRILMLDLADKALRFSLERRLILELIAACVAAELAGVAHRPGSAEPPGIAVRDRCSRQRP